MTAQTSRQILDWRLPISFHVCSPRQRINNTLRIAPLLTNFGPLIWIDSVVEAAESIRAYRPAGIVTFSERAQQLTSELAILLGLNYHDRNTIELLTDKWAQRKALRAGGVDVTRSMRVVDFSGWKQAIEELNFPLVLKPAHGGGSKNTYFINDEVGGEILVRHLLKDEQPGLIRGGRARCRRIHIRPRLCPIWRLRLRGTGGLSRHYYKYRGNRQTSDDAAIS